MKDTPEAGRKSNKGRSGAPDPGNPGTHTGAAVGEDDRRRERRRRRARRRLIRRRRYTWTPWLLIRYAPSDNGKLRPIPDQTVFWASPDIWVESSDPSGNPVAGKETFVHATVFNLGKALARPTRVDFYFGDPSLGLGPGQMQFIGSEWVQIPAHAKRDVRCGQAWTPAFVNNGHECLIVNCTCEISDPIKSPFQPTLDRHVGQLNLTVLQGKPGQVLAFALSVYNLAPMLAKSTIAARVEHLAVERSATAPWSLRDIVLRGALPARSMLGGSGLGGHTPHIRSQLSEPTSAVVVSPDAGRYFADLLRTGTGLPSNLSSRDMVLHGATMEAFEQRRVDLELGVPANARPGDIVLFHFFQGIAGLQVGGYTVAVDVTA